MIISGKRDKFQISVEIKEDEEKLVDVRLNVSLNLEYFPKAIYKKMKLKLRLCVMCDVILPGSFDGIPKSSF